MFKKCCYAHSIDDPDCERNLEFAADFKKQSKICDKLIILSEFMRKLFSDAPDFTKKPDKWLKLVD